MCIFWAQSYAQTAKFILNNNSVKCEIYDSPNNKIAESKNGILDYAKQITRIEFKEEPVLGNKQCHYFQIGGSSLSFKNGNDYLWGKEKDGRDLIGAITLQPGNIIIIKRGNVEIGKIVVKPKALALEERIAKIKIIPLEKGVKDFTFEKKETRIFKYKISNITGINVDTVEIKCNNIKIPSNFTKDTIEFSINPSILEKDKEYTIICSLKISKGEKSTEKTYSIAKVSSPFESGLSVWKIATFALIILICILWSFVLFYRRRMIKKYGNEIELYDDTKNLIIISDDEIKIGDRANKCGSFLTKKGYFFEISKKNRFSWARVSAIRIRVTDKNGKYFEFDTNDNPGSYPLFKYVSNNNTEIQISKGTQVSGVEDTQEFEFENGYIIKIENKSISEIKYRFFSKEYLQYDVILRTDIPQVGDIVKSCTNKIIVLCDGRSIDVRNGKIWKILEAPNSMPNDNIPYEEIKRRLTEAERELKSRPTKKEYEALSKKLQESEQKNKENEEKINKIDELVEQAKKIAKAEEKKHMETIHKKDIIDNYISLSDHKQKLSKSENVAKDATDAKEKSEKELKQKESELNKATGKISELEKIVLDKKTEIITQKAVIAKLKEVARKKNVHFIYQVQETLEELSNTFKDVYKDMPNSTIKDGFISPMLKGVSGLGAGILSWAEDYTVKVAGDSDGFFGGDFMTMKEQDVKETISKKFISNIVKSDSFSKFVRLYQLSTVPFIRKQFIEAGMNIDVLNKLYYKVYVLVSEFGYQIICPKLFEEQHSDKKYQWFNSTNLFNIIELPEEEKKAIKEQGPETIIDVNQIGFISPWASRNATAVTQDF